MKIKYSPIRLGRKRKNSTAELILSKNVDFLKDQIKAVLNESYTGELEKIELTIIKPKKGLEAKFHIENIKDFELRKLLKDNLRNSIRKLTDDEINQNINNIFNQTKV